MIFRPVSPVSAFGPPTTNLPVGIDEHEPVLAQPRFVVELAREDRVEHVLDDVRLDLRLAVDSVGVLADDEQAIDLDGARTAVLVILVAHSDHRLAVGTQVLERARLANLGQAAANGVGEHDRQRHQLRRLATRVAEHHPLVASTDRSNRPAGRRAHLVRLVDAAGDVG